MHRSTIPRIGARATAGMLAGLLALVASSHAAPIAAPTAPPPASKQTDVEQRATPLPPAMPVAPMPMSLAPPQIPWPASKDLPEPAIQALCDQFDGKPSFVDSEGRNTIDCGNVHRLVALHGENVVRRFHRAMREAYSLAGLRTARLPADLECGDFREREQGGERRVRCTTPMGDKAMDFDFVADRDGRIDRVETSLPYRSVLVDTWNQSVSLGRIKSYSPSWVDLQVAIVIARCHNDAGPRDQILYDGDQLRIVVFADNVAVPH